MNETNNGRRGVWPVVVAAVGAFLIFAVLVWVTRQMVQPPPLDAERVAFRYKSLEEVRGVDSQALTTVGWMDQAKGIVRLPIEDAMMLMQREWQNPAQARSNLIARVEKATALPPKAPEKPSKYE